MTTTTAVTPPPTALPPSADFAQMFAQDVGSPGSRVDALTAAIKRENLVLQNVVGNVCMSKRVDHVAYTRKHNRPSAYTPPRFKPAAVVRYADINQTTLLLFNAGRVVAVGSMSTEQTMCALHRIRCDLLATNVPAGMSEFDLVNMVYVLKVAGIRGINLARISKERQRDTKWMPHRFPGLRCRIGKLLLRLFDTRKVIAMGARDRAQLRASFAAICDFCTQYEGESVPEESKRFQRRLTQAAETTNPLTIESMIK